MALKDAVLEVIEQMENDRNPDILTYARQLRLLIKAADNVSPPFSVHPHPFQQLSRQSYLPESDTQLEEKVKQQADKEESYGQRMVVIAGGSCDGDMVAINATMPVGARTLLVGQVYQLQGDGKLHFDETATAGLKSG